MIVVCSCLKTVCSLLLRSRFQTLMSGFIFLTLLFKPSLLNHIFCQLFWICFSICFFGSSVGIIVHYISCFITSYTSIISAVCVNNSLTFAEWFLASAVFINIHEDGFDVVTVGSGNWAISTILTFLFLSS